ncbi:MAG: hypothetical protein KDC95_09640 [Planctomycetes bacterium]|nr:hypothetical protein [Planctomycetota bacterium]
MSTSSHSSGTPADTFEGRFARVLGGIGAFGCVTVRNAKLGTGITLPEDAPPPTSPWILGLVEGLQLAAKRLGREASFDVVSIETSNADTSDWSMRCAAFLAAWQALGQDVDTLRFDPSRRMFEVLPQ